MQIVEINKIPAYIKISCAAAREKFAGLDAKGKKFLANPIPYKVVIP